MIPRLVAISGPDEGETFHLGDGRFVVGRDRSCDLRIASIEISRRHCEIVQKAEGRYLLRDLDSRHGTSVNGRPVQRKDLEHSDLIAVGTSAFLFLLDASSDDITAKTAPSTTLTLAVKPTQSLHLDPARVLSALPAQARLARELHALLRLAMSLNDSLEIEPVAQCLLDAAVEALPVDGGWVALREPGLVEPRILAHRGDRTEVDSRLVEQTLREGVTTVRGADEGDTRVTAPLSDAEDRSFGALQLARHEASFDEAQVELASAFAAVASLAFQNALHLRWLRRENRRLRDEQAAVHDMLGESTAMRQVFDLIARVARADTTVLIQGESGTGKELAARAIHRSSPRNRGPFVAVNCATLSENLLESELFGHERGAFTGATVRKIGKMEIADRGTIFLDEVAEIPLALQAKLLRALQEREIERVGGSRPITVDVRVLAASHRDLTQAVEEGAFRQDLLFRLKVVTCELPPLRERREDIPLLAAHFSQLHGRQLGLKPLAITPAARECLLAHAWPGNVRELANVIERAVVLGDGERIRREDLPEEVIAAALPRLDASQQRTDAAKSDFQVALATFKSQLILDAWRQSGEDYARTAQQLGIHVNSLHRLVRELGLKPALGR